MLYLYSGRGSAGWEGGGGVALGAGAPIIF